MGMSLMPASNVAQEKGIYVPWMITWGMIWLSVLIGAAIGIFVVATGLGKAPAAESHMGKAPAAQSRPHSRA